MRAGDAVENERFILTAHGRLVIRRHHHFFLVALLVVFHYLNIVQLGKILITDWSGH
jgi:hypothetical protein